MHSEETNIIMKAKTHTLPNEYIPTNLNKDKPIEPINDTLSTEQRHTGPSKDS